MARGRKIEPVELSAEEREILQGWAGRRKTAQGLATRSRIVLLAAEGWTSSAVAVHLHVTRVTVGKWRSRFLDRRLDGLVDEPRPGAPRKVMDADVERVITMTLESIPKGATHWSSRSMAEAGRCQGSCRLRQDHAGSAARSLHAAGLSVTLPRGSQFRMPRAHRSGRRRRALS